MLKQNITFAVFDVRPVDPETKRVDFDFINNLEPTVDLKPYKKDKNLTVRNIPASTSGLDTKDVVLKELEITLAKDLNFKKEVRLFGGRLVGYYPGLSSKTGDEDNNLSQFRDEFSKLLAGRRPHQKTNQFRPLPPPLSLPWAPESDIEPEERQEVVNLSPVARDLDIVLTGFRSSAFNYYPESEEIKEISEPEETVSPDLTINSSISSSYEILEKRFGRSLIYFASFLSLAFVLTFISVKSFDFGSSILQRSNQAYLNLNLARENISEFNFFEAASSFTLAAENFELIHSDFKKASSVLGVLDTITLGGTSDVSDLVKAGELVSQSGLDLASALEKISNVNLISIIQPESNKSILAVLNDFRVYLIQASRNLSQAGNLISQSDNSLIPESERQKVEEFKNKLPEFSGYLERAVGYSDAIVAMLGQAGPQKYLLLFQNTSELRPTGGFPGSYALVEFNKGKMNRFAVDDIYNPDGQMKEKIIPPRPLQRITPNWGMRDANWFIDFRSSAKKVAEFYFKDIGILVDGVIAVNVDLMPEILNITGPIEMPEFGISLDSQNFRSEIQKEVEYEKTKGEGRPKQVLVEFAPLLLERLSNLDQDGWMKIFTLLVKGVENKNILAYFADSQLQNFALENGFAGEIKDGGSDDYLMIVHSNIMGSKTDAVIDNKVDLKIEEVEDGLIHTLKIKRDHQGGEFGFYNKVNNDYVRILVPEDAEILEISGNDNYEPVSLIDYTSLDFVSDPDLEKYESDVEVKNGVEIFKEGGKNVFAFWLITRPGEAKTAVLKYKTPKYLGIYIQKQPGAKGEFNLNFAGKNLFDGKLYSDKNIELGIIY